MTAEETIQSRLTSFVAGLRAGKLNWSRVELLNAFVEQKADMDFLEGLTSNHEEAAAAVNE